MRTRIGTSYWPLLIVLAAIWGASYLFIKVAVRDLEPTTTMCARSLIAAVLLLPYVAAKLGRATTLSQLRAAWADCAVLGAINAAVPFTLVAWGETHVDSSVAGIAQATVPLFSFLLGLRLLAHEPVARARWLGLAVGIAGVAVLAGLHPRGGWWAVAGTLAVVLSSVSYASGSIYGQRRVGAVPGPVLAAGSMLASGAMLAPFAALQLPGATPGWKATSSLLALAVLGTALAQLILFRLLATAGARRTSLVTYLMPGFALAYGAVLLDEPVTDASLLGLALILVGVALGSGTLRRFERSGQRLGVTSPDS
jgi:drug/metabolite transporter (DMT)-like permease